MKNQKVEIPDGPLWTLHFLALYEVDDVFGDVGGVVASVIRVPAVIGLPCAGHGGLIVTTVQSRC